MIMPCQGVSRSRDPAQGTHDHNQGATLSFADGHAENWKWRASTPKPEHHCDVVEAPDSGDRADLQRLERAVPQQDIRPASPHGIYTMKTH
jgi:prepilin-type processing-associated H-X9-DG protein